MDREILHLSPRDPESIDCDSAVLFQEMFREVCLPPCNFFLFGYLKKELEGRNFIYENEVISAMRTILKAIPIRVLSEVFGQWIAKLHKSIVSGGVCL
jgi:hypothetical protein